MLPWQWLIHFTGSDYTGRPGHWVPYSFWSGVAGSFLTQAIAFGLVFWAHHSCHYAWWCWRRARMDLAGGVGRVCHRHYPHPDLAGQRRPRGKRLHDLHRKLTTDQED